MFCYNEDMNMFDYLNWRGDLTFEQSAFNEVDNLIISEMSYTTFDKFIDSTSKYTVKQLSDIFFSNVSKEEIDANKSFVKEAPYVLKAMAESNRFKDAVMHNFISKIDKESTEQFCAFCLDLSDGTTFIVFRGTDDTLIGWREDFLLSYTTIKAQKEALQYLKENIKPNKKYRVGGHSKGGNLAEYACIWLEEEKQNQILNIYSNDGPGNKSTFLPENYIEIYARLKDKLIKFVPEIDIFGAIYSNKVDSIVIKSDGNLLIKHNAPNWNVLGTSFVRSEESIETQISTKTFKEFLNSVNEQDKKEFVDELFNSLADAGFTNISEISSGGLPVFIDVIRKFSNLNEDTKETAKLLLDIILKNSKTTIINEANVIKDNVADKLVSAKNTVIDKLKNINNK